MTWGSVKKLPAKVFFKSELLLKASQLLSTLMIIRNIIWAPNQHIIMISEGWCDFPNTFHEIVHIHQKNVTMFLFFRVCRLQRNSAYMAQMAFYEEVWKNNPASVSGAGGSGGTVCSSHWSMHVHQTSYSVLLKLIYFFLVFESASLALCYTSSRVLLTPHIVWLFQAYETEFVCSHAKNMCQKCKVLRDISDTDSAFRMIKWCNKVVMPAEIQGLNKHCWYQFNTRCLLHMPQIVALTTIAVNFNRFLSNCMFELWIVLFFVCVFEHLDDFYFPVHSSAFWKGLHYSLGWMILHPCTLSHVLGYTVI